MHIKLSFILIFTIFVFFGCQSGEVESEEKLIPVKVFELQPKTISKTIKLTGSVTSSEDVILYSKISEKLERINIKAGERVNKGEILAIQYNAMFKQAVDAAEAVYQNAEAQVNLIRQEFERIERLFNQKAVSQQQYDQVLAQKKTAISGLDQADAMVKQAKEQYDNSFIKAPFEGIVAAVYFELNQMVPVGQPILQIIGLEGMKAKLRVTAKDIPFLKMGQNVIVKFPSIPETDFNAVVSSINQSVDMITKSLEIEIKLKDKDQRIKSGLFGEFYIEVKSKENTIVIPESALLRQTEVVIDRNTGIQTPVRKHFVFVVKNSIADLLEVEPGIANNGTTEITKGLSIGDTLIIVGQNIVKEGQKVNVVE